jgi:hypothetical protein
MRRKVKIKDRLFAHVQYSTLFQESKYIEWDRTNGDADIVFYTDYNLGDVAMQKTGKKYAWILESPEITRQAYSWINDNYDKFDLIFTHNRQLLEKSDKFSFAPTGGCWIKPEDQKIYEKNKMFSTITSSKNFLYGHKLRHEVIRNFKNIDVYGGGYTRIENKITGLKDYRFSFAIENVKQDYYFTEKLIDCFRTGTVPIYWGCPSIGDFFNEKGMVLFDNIDDLKEKINIINDDTYKNMVPYIEENFEKSKEFLMSEDYIWKNNFL